MNLFLKSSFVDKWDIKAERGGHVRSLKHQMLILLLGSLILLATSFLVVLGYQVKERSGAAALIKAQTDLATCGEIIDKTYPGTWSVQDGNLYKGKEKISLNNDLVDHLSRLTGDTVTVFLGETRVATTIRGSNGERVIGTKVAANVAQTVLQEGQTYLGEADIVGQWYPAGYAPLRDESGNIIGMFYVGISPTYEQEFITRALLNMAELGLALTVLVALLAWFLLRRMIRYPLSNLRLGSSEAATEPIAQKEIVSGTKEIEELEEVFNQMVERIQVLTGEFNRTMTVNLENDLPEDTSYTDVEQVKGSESIAELTIENTLTAEPKAQSKLDTPWCNGEVGLPKGLNKATLDHIVQFLQVTRRPLSAEEVAEGVKLTRVTVRRYLEFLEQRGVLKSEQKFGTVGRPVKLFIPL